MDPVMSLACINEISVYNDTVSNQPVSHASLDLRSFYLELLDENEAMQWL